MHHIYPQKSETLENYPSPQSPGISENEFPGFPSSQENFSILSSLVPQFPRELGILSSLGNWEIPSLDPDASAQRLPSPLSRIRRSTFRACVPAAKAPNIIGDQGEQNLKDYAQSRLSRPNQLSRAVQSLMNPAVFCGSAGHRAFKTIKQTV